MLLQIFVTEGDTMATLRKNLESLNSRFGISSESEQSTYSGNGETLRDKLSALNSKFEVSGDEELYEMFTQRSKSVSNWASRYNKLIDGFNAYEEKRNGAHIANYGGEFTGEIDSLIQDYDTIKEYAGRMGIPNSQQYLKQLLELRQYITGTKSTMTHFSGAKDYNTAVRYSGYYQKYNGQTYSQIQDALSKMENGEEKEWLSQFARQTMTDRDFGIQAAQYNTDIYYAQKYLDEYKTLSDAYGTGGQEADERILSQMQALSEKYGFKNKQEAESALSRLTGEKWMLDRERKYSGLEKNADFNLESAVAAEAPTSRIGISYGRKYYGVGDAVYDYINDLGGSREYAVYSSGEDGHVNPYEIYNYMKEDEIAKYNYLYNTEGKKSADDYLDYLEYTLTARRTKRLSGLSNEFANKHPHLADITSVPLNLMGGLGAADAAVQNAVKSLAENVTGEYAGPVDYNSWGFNANTLSSGIRSTRSQNLADKYGSIELSEEEHPVLSRVLNGKNVGELYQLGMSMLDSSAVAMLSPIIGSAGTYLLGGSAATQSVLESVKNGASDEQALMMGLLSGAAEVIFEKYELENLLGADTNWVKALANQALTEAVGEGATTIANAFSDILVMGDKSEYMTNVRKYQNQGMSTQKAELNAFLDAAISVGWDAIGGLLSGGIMGAVASPIENTAQKYSQAKEIYGSEPGALVTEALEINPNNKFAQKMQGRIESGKDLSGYQLNRLVNQNEKALRSQDIEAIRKSAENRLNDLGESGDVSAISAAIAKQASGKTLSSAESSLIKDSKYGTIVLNELNPDNIRSGGYASEWAMEINSQRINQDVYNRPDSAVEVNSTHGKEPSSNVGKTETTDLHTSEQADGTKNDSIVRNTLNTESKTAQNDFVRQAPVEDKPFELSDETGKTLLNLSDGSTVETEIISIASTGKGKLMLNVAGQSAPVKASSISYANNADAILYNAINSMEISPEDAKRFVNLARSSGDTTGDFAVGIQQMYILGKSGVPISKAMNSRYGAKLSDTNKRFGYGLGRALYNAQVQKAESEKKNVAASQRARAATGGTKVNGVHYDGLTVSRGKDGSVAIEGVTLNAQQKAGIQAAEMLAGMGVNIHVYQSRTDANGKPIGENGSYHLRDGSIHIDLNAGNLGQGVMLYTIAHEFTHFMEQQSPAKFQAFTDALFAELDTDAEEEIERKAKELKRQHPEQYRNASRDTLLEDARSEVVSEACETMLTDTDAAQRIGQSLKAKDATLFEKVKQWFRDIAAKLRKAYKGLHPDSEIAQYAKKTIQQVDGLVQLWADMAVDAAENYREGAGSGNVALDGGVKYSLNKNAETELHRALYDKNFKGEVLLRDVTPEIMLSQKGVRNLPMSMNASHIRENVFSEAEAEKMGLRIGKGINYHGIGEELFLKIIDGLDNVREAYRGTKNADNPSRSTNYFLLISEFSDSYGNRINVPVYIDEHGSVNNVILDVNKISTVYGKRNLQEYIQRQVKNGNLIRIKNRSNLTSESQAPIARDYGEKASKYSIRDTEPVVNQKNSELNDVESDFYNAGVKYSSRVTDKDTLSFLDNQETITTYKTMQIVDGKLYPPMAARIDGKHEDYSVLGVWEQATEHPELIKGNGKFKLDKGKGQGSIEAAYNPYMHSSNLVINDQFTGAYARDNLVTVECEVPASELSSGYHAQYAKDSVGWHAWHTGTVAGAIRKAKGIERQVFLSRWIKPVRIVTDAEVASMYRDLLDGTDIAVPDNVVTPSLLSELKKAGVTISESGRVKLTDLGMNVVSYEHGNEESRTAALNSLDGVKFSNRNTTEEMLTSQNEKLKADVQNLRELLKLQGKTTGGKLFKPESIKTAANFIMRETGRSLDADGKAEFAGLLTKAYTALSDENVTYDDIIRECTNVAQWLDENGETKDALDEYAGGILSEMKGTPIRLDETQKAEARHLFGSLREFRSRIAGTYKLSPDGVPLDDVWNGLSIEHPMFFDGDASSAGLPGLLVEAIDRLRGSVNTDPYQHMPVDMMMRKVYDGFWKARKLTTVADRYQSKIDAINAKHDAAMQEMQEAHKAEISDLNRQWDAEAAAMEKSHKYDLEEQERLHKEHLRQVREEMNHDAEAELEKVIGQYRDQRKASVENRHRTQYREQIYKMADKFHKIATAPAKANTAHAPIQLVNAVAKFCEIFADSEERALEYAANRLDSRETEMRLMNDLRGETKTRLKEADAINRQRERIYKKHQAVSAMKEQYESIQKDSVYSMFYDEHVDGLLKSLSEQLDGTDIYDMDTEQLKQVYSTMQAMMYTITNANRVFSMEKDKTLIGVTRKLAGEIDANKISHGAFVSGLRDYGMWQMSPDTFFNFVCGFKKGNEGKAIQKMFVDGTDRMLEVQRDFYQMFRHLTEAEDKNVRNHITQMMKNPMKEMIDWGMNDAAGNPVKTTRDMMIQAYMLLNQKDSFDSMIYGGFALPNAKDYYNGKIDRAYGNAEEYQLLSASIENDYNELVRQIKQRQDSIDGGGLDVKSVNQLQEEITSLRDQAIELVKGSEARLIEMRDAIEAKLTDVDFDAIETAKRWYKYSGQLMSDVHLQMYGYRPNLVDGYVPIHRDLSTVKTDIREGEEDKAFNLENSGFTKERVRSTAPILLTGFFQELQSQQIKISRYYGFAQVQKDFNRIWNMRVPGYGTTIKKKVSAKFGTGKRWLGVSGEQYVLNYIQSVAGVKGNDDILSSFYGNAASATLSANPRVAVSQLASIPTAAAVVGWKSMAKGFAKGVSTSISTEKKNLLANDSVWFFQRYRGAGGITEISDLKAKGGFWGKIANSKVGKGLFNWCQSMDVFATASMWAMAEDYVQQGGMKTTDDGYKLAVEQCYADIIRRSQPNYTVTERSDLLRDKRGGMKLLTMYKTQSNQNLNILINSIGEYRAAATAMRSVKNETTIADFKAAKNNLINGVTSVAVGGTLVFVLLRTMINFIMAKVDPYRDDETDELTMESAMGAITQEIFSSISGMFALGGQLYDIVNSVVSGDNYYGISDSAISSLAAVPENMVALIQRWKDPDKDVEWKHVEKVLSSSLALCGIPYKNLRSFYDAAGQWYRDLKGGTFWQYVTDATDKQYRARILKAWQSGDMEKINDTLAILAAKSEEDTDEDILKDVTHGFANNYLKDKVKDDEISPEDAADLLKYIGHDDPDGVVAKWVFQNQYPDSGLSDTGIRTWNQNQDIPLDVFEKVWKYKADHGKTEVVSYITKLKISDDMKRRIWDAVKGNWKDKDTPWE